MNPVRVRGRIDHSKILERRRKTIGCGTYFYELLPEEERVRKRESCNKYMKAHPEVNARKSRMWRENNRKKFNAGILKCYHKRMKDPEYRKSRAEYVRKRYLKSKEVKE